MIKGKVYRQYSTRICWYLVPANFWDRLKCRVTFGRFGRSHYIRRDESQIVTYYPETDGRSSWLSFENIDRFGAEKNPPHINCRCRLTKV